MTTPASPSIERASVEGDTLTAEEIEICLSEARKELEGVSHGAVEIIVQNGRFERVCRNTTRKRPRN